MTSMAVAFSPWIVSSGLVQSPSLMSGPGAQIQHLNSWSVRFEAPEGAPVPSGSGVVAFAQSQKRKPQP